MSVIDYSKDRKKATIVIDEFNGSVGASSGSAATQPNSQYLKLDPGVMLDLENVLCDVQGVARMRGSIKAGAAGANDITTSSSGVLKAALTSVSTATAGPYFWFSDGSGKWNEQTSAAATTTLITNVAAGVPTTKPTMVGDLIVFGGRRTSSGVTNQPIVSIIGTSGFVGQYNTGTVTITAGSTTVTGAGTTFTAAMVGATIEFSADTAANYSIYTIKRFVSATVVILDRPYNGGSAGAAKAYTINSAGGNITTGTGSPWGVSGAGMGFVQAKVAIEHANRLFVGWTKEPESVTADPLAASAAEFRSRLRWSGVVGSSEGNGSLAVTGMFGWSTTGFLDLNTRYGGIVAMSSFGGYLIVWQDFGMTILYGTPTFSTAGSLDTTTSFANIQINGGFAYENTDYGTFFVDGKRGPMVYNGSGNPTSLPMSRTIRERLKGANHVGYVNNHVLFMSSTNFGSATLEMWAFHIPSQTWTRFTNSGVYTLTHPQRSNDHECCALMSNATGSRVVSLDSLTIPDGTVTDTDGTTTYTKNFTLQTGHFGDPAERLRAHTMYVTVRATGSPSLDVELRTGLPITQDAGHKSTARVLNGVSTGSSGADVDTYNVEAIQHQNDNSVSVRVTDSSGLAGHLEIVQVRIECAVEGMAATS